MRFSKFEFFDNCIATSNRAAKSVAAVLGLFLYSTLNAAAPVEAMPFASPRLAGLMTDARLVEFSGMAPARRKDRFWAINDGGQDPILWQIDNKGKIKSQLLIEGVQNIDFEDLASFSLKPPKGRRVHYVAVPDIGDNVAMRNDHKIYIMADVPGRKSATPEWTIHFRYPDSAHDAESMAVDAKEGYLYIVIKRVLPPVVYRLPLQPGLSKTGAWPNQQMKQIQIAERVGILEGIPESDQKSADPHNAVRYASQPTGAVIGCDGNELFLLTYASVYRYTKSEGQSWADALLGQMPQVKPLPLMFQAEAITLSRDCNSLYIGGEKVPGPLWRFSRVEQKPPLKTVTNSGAGK